MRYFQWSTASSGCGHSLHKFNHLIYHHKYILDIYIYNILVIVSIWKLNPVSKTAMVQYNSVDHHQSDLQKIVGQRRLAWQMLQWTPPKTNMLSLGNSAWKMKMAPLFCRILGAILSFLGLQDFGFFVFFPAGHSPQTTMLKLGELRRWNVEGRKEWRFLQLVRCNRSRQFKATSAEVTPKGSLVRESYPTNSLIQVRDL